MKYRVGASPITPLKHPSSMKRRGSITRVAFGDQWDLGVERRGSAGSRSYKFCGWGSRCRDFEWHLPCCSMLPNG